MLLLDIFNISLPIKNPVLLFSMILFIILFAPLILNKIKIPHLIGLIMAGAIIGPKGLNLMERDSSIVLYGTVGLLYIMFLAGLEIDLADFKKNSRKGLIYGLYTFLIPMILGILVGLFLLEFSWPTSILLASMFASHTLLAYPIISKLGVTKNRAVNITVGGTLITDTLALLVLAVIAGMSTGDVGKEFWIRLSISVILFGAAVMVLFPIIGRWYFKRFDDRISQYIFVLAMVFLGAFLAEAAGVEAIIGAFLVGLALNRLIPYTSPLMNRVEFVGNALFIPIFLIGVGMLVDFRVFFTGFETIKVAIIMVVTATLAKFLAAWAAQKTFRFTADERRLIFGLSNAQAAATLAAVTVGYNIILNKAEIAAAQLRGITLEPERLLNEDVLNGTIVMILVTCTIASFVAQKGAQNIALADNESKSIEGESNKEERILIPIGNPDSTNELISLSTTVKSSKNKRDLFALHVIDNERTDGAAERKGQKILDNAAVAAAATDNQPNLLLRYDVNIINGINAVVKEHKITDLVMGLSSSGEFNDNYLRSIAEGLLSKCNTTTLIYKSGQPLSTIKRHLIIVPDRAEREIGFPFWIIKMWNLGRNTGSMPVFYGSKQTLNIIKGIHAKHPIDCQFVEFSDWSDFLILSRDVKKDDNLIVVMSRKSGLSYNPNMAKVPTFLNKYFGEMSFIIVYPMQTGVDDYHDSHYHNPSMLEPMERLDEITRVFTGLFKKL